MTKKPTSVIFTTELLEKIKVAAKAEDRDVSSWIRVKLTEALERINKRGK